MFPPATQRIAKNAIIGGVRQSAAWGTKACWHAAVMHAMCMSRGHAWHVKHASKPRCAGIRGGWPPPCTTVGCRPQPPTTSVRPLARGSRRPASQVPDYKFKGPFRAKRSPCVLPWVASCRRWWVSLGTIDAMMPDGGATPWGNKLTGPVSKWHAMPTVSPPSLGNNVIGLQMLFQIFFEIKIILNTLIMIPRFFQCFLLPLKGLLKMLLQGG